MLCMVSVRGEFHQVVEVIWLQAAPHCRRTRTVSSWRQCVPLLIHTFLDPPESKSQAASWSVQAFLEWPYTLQWAATPPQNSNGVTPQWRRHMQVGRLNAGVVAANWQLSTNHLCQFSSVASLSHWASTLFVCSTFAMMQRDMRVCQQQLIFFSMYPLNALCISISCYIILSYLFCIRCLDCYWYSVGLWCDWLMRTDVTGKADWAYCCWMSAMESWCLCSLWWPLCLLCYIGHLYLPGAIFWFLLVSLKQIRIIEFYFTANRICFFCTREKQHVLSSSWDGWPFGHNRHGPKLGVLCPLFFWGGRSPHLTQCRLGRDLPPY